jgi:hypothetical protein
MRDSDGNVEAVCEKTSELHMINIGTSAFLKLAALSPKLQISEIKKRLGESKGGYDFHKKMRKIVGKFASGKYEYQEIIADINAISKLPERMSAAEALNEISTWKIGKNVNLVSDFELKFASPNMLFSVKFVPDIELIEAGSKTYIHLWNTKKPKLTSREALGLIGMFKKEEDEYDLAVLCLRTKKLYVCSDLDSAKVISGFLVGNLENVITEISTGEPGSEGKDSAAA